MPPHYMHCVPLPNPHLSEARTAHACAQEGSPGHCAPLAACATHACAPQTSARDPPLLKRVLRMRLPSTVNRQLIAPKEHSPRMHAHSVHTRRNVSSIPRVPLAAFTQASPLSPTLGCSSPTSDMRLPGVGLPEIGLLDTGWQGQQRPHAPAVHITRLRRQRCS